MTSQKMKDADMPLRDRIEAAIERIKTGQGQMRVPVEATDPDVVLADCLAELDAARAREVELTDAIDSLIALITGETGENCDVQRAIEALSETRAQFEARILKREAKLREALKAVVNGNDIAAERNHSIESWPGSPIRCQAIAALAEGEPHA